MCVVTFFILSPDRQENRLIYFKHYEVSGSKAKVVQVEGLSIIFVDRGLLSLLIEEKQFSEW